MTASPAETLPPLPTKVCICTCAYVCEYAYLCYAYCDVEFLFCFIFCVYIGEEMKVEAKSSEQKTNEHRSKHSETEQRRRSKINER